MVIVDFSVRELRENLSKALEADSDRLEFDRPVRHIGTTLGIAAGCIDTALRSLGQFRVVLDMVDVADKMKRGTLLIDDGETTDAIPVVYTLHQGRVGGHIVATAGANAARRVAALLVDLVAGRLGLAA